MVLVRYAKLNENKIFMEEIQNRYWQYLVESVIKRFKHYKSHLKHCQKLKEKL